MMQHTYYLPFSWGSERVSRTSRPIPTATRLSLISLVNANPSSASSLAGSFGKIIAQEFPLHAVAPAGAVIADDALTRVFANLVAAKGKERQDRPGAEMLTGPR